MTLNVEATIPWVRMKVPFWLVNPRSPWLPTLDTVIVPYMEAALFNSPETLMPSARNMTRPLVDFQLKLKSRILLSAVTFREPRKFSTFMVPALSAMAEISFPVQENDGVSLLAPTESWKVLPDAVAEMAASPLIVVRFNVPASMPMAETRLSVKVTETAEFSSEPLPLSVFPDAVA